MLSAVSGFSRSAVSTLQSLRSLNSEVSTVQKEIATGKRVSTAKDNAAVWSLSKSMESELATNKELLTNLSHASATTAAASAALESMVTMLQGMKTSAISYETNGTSVTNGLNALKDTFDQFADILTGASFQGTNLLTTGTDKVYTIGYSNNTALTMTIEATDVDAGTAYAALAAGLDTGGTPFASYAALSTGLDNAITELKTMAIYYGNASEAVDVQSGFRQALNDNLSTTLSSLVDTDMDEASARLTALQTQQQLATQLISITTQNQSTLIQTLFRGF